jgi:hypothetical protein
LKSSSFHRKHHNHTATTASLPHPHNHHVLSAFSVLNHSRQRHHAKRLNRASKLPNRSFSIDGLWSFPVDAKRPEIIAARQAAMDAAKTLYDLLWVKKRGHCLNSQP